MMDFESRAGDPDPIARVIILAWIAQGLGLRALAVSQGPPPTVWVAVWATPVALAAWGPCLASRLRARWRPGEAVASGLAAGWATAAFGGLGMALGAWVDGLLGVAAHHAGVAAHHGHAAHGVAAFGNWATALMLIFCLLVCLGFCGSQPGSAWRSGAVGMSGMVAGMLAGGAVLGAPLIALTGSAVLGGHLAMVLGMGLGAGAASALLDAGWRRPRAVYPRATPEPPRTSFAAERRH